MIKSIDTYYKGNYYRSRLEARWAVFFDEWGVPFEYEPTGFVLSNGHKYLPDFYLPKADSYVEVKPSSQFKMPKEMLGGIEEIEKHPDFATKWQPFSEDKKLLLCIGNPGEQHLWQLTQENEVGAACLSRDRFTSRMLAAIRTATKKRFEYSTH